MWRAGFSYCLPAESLCYQGEPDPAISVLLGYCASALVWSEPDSVAYTESLGYIVDCRAVYILGKSSSAPVLSLGRLWIQLTKREFRRVRTCEGEFQSISRGESWMLARSRYSPALSK